MVDTAAPTVPPDATVAELFWQHFVGARQPAVAVVDGHRYLGIARAEGLADLDRTTWATTTVADVVDDRVPAVGLDGRVDDALRVMDEEYASLALEAEGSWLLVDCPHPLRKMLREASARAGLSLRFV